MSKNNLKNYTDLDTIKKEVEESKILFKSSIGPLLMSLEIC